MCGATGLALTHLHAYSSCSDEVKHKLKIYLRYAYHGLQELCDVGSLQTQIEMAGRRVGGHEHKALEEFEFDDAGGRRMYDAFWTISRTALCLELPHHIMAFIYLAFQEACKGHAGILIGLASP